MQPLLEDTEARPENYELDNLLVIEVPTSKPGKAKNGVVSMLLFSKLLGFARSAC